MIFTLIPTSKSNQDNGGGYAVNIAMVGLVKHTVVKTGRRRPFSLDYE